MHSPSPATAADSCQAACCAHLIGRPMLRIHVMASHTHTPSGRQIWCRLVGDIRGPLAPATRQAHSLCDPLHHMALTARCMAAAGTARVAAAAGADEPRYQLLPRGRHPRHCRLHQPGSAVAAGALPATPIWQPGALPCPCRSPMHRPAPAQPGKLSLHVTHQTVSTTPCVTAGSTQLSPIGLSARKAFLFEVHSLGS